MEHKKDGLNSLTRMLSILDLFHKGKPLWSTQEILAAINVSRATGYRYIRAMTDVGLFSSVGNGYYILGPRIIELDLQIRNTDPMLHASKGILERLSKFTNQSSLLCTLFQNAVLCVQECPIIPGRPELVGRGQRISLFEGAISTVILANLPAHSLRAIYSRRQDEIEKMRLGKTWKEFRTNMASIRNSGVSYSIRDFHGTMATASAPVFNSENEVIGSVAVAWDINKSANFKIDQIILHVKQAGEDISAQLRSQKIGEILRPRAVK